MNARDIVRTVMRDRYRRHLVIPNYTPPRWWECDVFELTEAGYFREYEVKVSRPDFRADADKRKWLWDERGSLASREKVAKHDLLDQRSPNGPTRFWYVTPAGLVAPDEVPPWAGLIQVSPHPRGYEGWQWARLTEVVKAPQIHREPATEAVAKDARRTCYWRMHNAIVGTGTGIDDEPAEYVI